MFARPAAAALGIGLTAIVGLLALGTLADPLGDARFAVVLVLTFAALVLPVALGIRGQPRAPRVYW